VINIWIRRIPVWVWLTLLTLGVLLPGTAALPLLDRDEPRFATATREMMDRGDWVVPTFNGQNRFDKPILIYWLMRAGYAVVGVGELGARLPSVFAALALVLLTAWVGRRWLGGACGWLGGAGLATCLQMFIHGRLALADMVMVMCVGLAQIALGELLLGADDNAAETGARRRWRWILWIALGLGFLAKGPIAWAVPLVTALLFRWVFMRRPLPWVRLGAGWGLVVMFVLIASWGVPALVRTHGEFFKVGVGKHVVDRGLEGFNGRAYSPFFYLATAPVSLFPWIALLPVVFTGLRRRWSPPVAWLLSWATAPYLIFTCYSTQLPHYVLPAFPAVFLLIAAGWEQRGGFWPRAGRVLLWVLLACACGLACVIARAAVPEAEALRPSLLGVCAILGGLSVFALAVCERRTWMMVPGLLAVVIGAHTMGAGLRSVHLTLRATETMQTLPAATRVVGLGFAEPSLVFYSNRHWQFTSEPKIADAMAVEAGPMVVITLKREIDPVRFWQARVRQTWKTRQGEAYVPPGAGWRSELITGFNVGRTRWQELVVWTREK
jgi:4-amino-4-deoxy-L-arabinose transferase-like glycosyltransferase